MDVAKFCDACPVLWHCTAIGQWGVIARHGLQTAAQLIEAADLSDEERRALRTEPRQESVTLRLPDGRNSTIRDQVPLGNRERLTRALDGPTVEEWLALLDRRVYWFSRPGPMSVLRDKYVAAGGQDVIAVATRTLIDRLGNRVEVSARNAGAIGRISEPYKRLDDFRPVAAFEGSPSRVREVTVVGGIDEVEALSPLVERHYPDGRIDIVRQSASVSTLRS